MILLSLVDISSANNLVLEGLMMNNLILFVNSFLSYLIMFLVFLVLIVAAVFAGIKVRKNKNKKDEIAESAASLEAAAVKKEA